jgi:hypothetical protein
MASTPDLWKSLKKSFSGLADNKSEKVYSNGVYVFPECIRPILHNLMALTLFNLFINCKYKSTAALRQKLFFLAFH